MKRFYVIAFLLIFSITLFSQNGIRTNKKLKAKTTLEFKTEHCEFFCLSERRDSLSGIFKMKITPFLDRNTMDEAFEKNIQKDKILIQFIVNDNCDIIDIKVKEKGKLESFNNLMSLVCSELLIELTKRNELDILIECKDFISPAYFSLR